ncbi:MAG TPA: ABC transporter permease [Cytophagaceae bacterium]|nr:ABC transporter permease [Cytophagaceae bacterium]
MSKINYYNSRLKTYYETVKVVASKNLKLRYKNSMFGFLWTLINPLFLLLIFIFVFGHVVSGINNYPLYVTSGLIIWTFFVSSSNQIINKILESGSILTSINIPAIIFPLSALISNLVNLLLSLIPFIGVMVFYGFRPDWNTLLFIPAIIIFTAFTFGVSLTLSCLNVYFRDVEMFWTTITPALFYATPVVYKVPPEMEKVMIFNPFAHYINLFHTILYDGNAPDAKSWLICIIMAVFVVLLSLFVYKKLKNGFISNF